MGNLAAWAPTVVAIVVAVFTYGKYSSKLDAHGDRLDAHDDKFESHGEHLQRVDIALVKLEQYNRGFADATNLANKARGAGH